jgi:Protein of unknown function (DUF2878)
VTAAAALPAGAVPTRRHQLLNFVLLQAGWFAIVLGAANGHAAWGAAAAAAIVGWHLAIVARPAIEAQLVGAVLLLGLVFDSLALQTGWVSYVTGEGVGSLAPYWMLALWALFATALNVPLRWLKGRWWLAAVLGAVSGPLSYVAGVKLGAAAFADATAAIVMLAIGWAAVMPALVALAMRFDGVLPADRGAARA